MDDIFEKLRALQDILSQKIILEQEILEIPKFLSTQEEVLERTKKTFFDLNQDYDKAKAAESEYQRLLSEAEELREKAEKNMDIISTQREYEALDKEIHEAADKEQQFRKELQREQRAIAELDEQIKQRAALIEQQEADLAERRKGIQKQAAQKQSQMDALNAEERKMTHDMDTEVLFKFERIIRNKMGKGIVAIKGGVCMGCHMILPVQFANDVHMGKELVFCPYCSRILFYEEAEQGEEEFFNIDEAGSLSDLDDMDEEDFDEDDEEEEKINIDFEE
jgi:predicted  nucleic acid-binding Zn-ribbon protein